MSTINKLQRQVNKLLEMKETYDKHKKAMEEIENNSPAGDPTMADRELRHSYGNHQQIVFAYQDKVTELPVLQRELEEYQQLPLRERQNLYEQEKKILTEQNLTPSQYEEEIQVLTEILNL